MIHRLELESSNSSIIETKAKLLGSLLFFTQTFYKIRTGREFELSEPAGRESHYISVCRELMKVFDGETKRLIINIPPRYGKTELIIHFIAWAMARYPDSNFIYVSYALGLAKKQTATVRQIMNLPAYKKLFGVVLSEETNAKGNFETDKGGSLYATGAGGEITGRGAGLQGANRFAGAILIDDIHKPIEVTSDTVRQTINDWYYNTLQSRLNDRNTPIIFICQRLHEDDLAANLLKTGEWESLVIPALDLHNNPLHPKKHSLEDLLKMKETMPYEFDAQYMQSPTPAGGGIFKPEWFILMDEEPEILATFITADTAETDKDYNDATVFSFFGIYKIKQFGQETGLMGLHWIDCHEIRIEPKDLQDEFLNFYSICMRYKVKPGIAGIEKKSTGTTLASVLSGMQGLRIIDIGRFAKKTEGRFMSKTARFLEIQPYVAEKFISLPRYGKHTHLCIEHCRKITANNSHRHDDIADTLYDGIKLGLIDKVIMYNIDNSLDEDKARIVMSSFNTIQRARENIYGRR